MTVPARIEPSPADGLGQPMSWEEYERLGEDIRAQYVDGRLVMSPSPSRRHQRVARRLANGLEAVLPDGWQVDAFWGWKPGRDEFIPDVIVYPETEEQVRFTGTPALVVEVLSGNRSTDLVVKVGKYAAAGLAHYWVLDLRDEVLEAFALRNGMYEPAARLERDQRADLGFGIATLQVDLGALLSPR